LCYLFTCIITVYAFHAITDDLSNRSGCFSLEYLNISHVGVSEVYFPVCQAEQKTALFSTLKQLNLSGNNIHSVSFQ
jgi:hypothetical protein